MHTPRMFTKSFLRSFSSRVAKANKNKPLVIRRQGEFLYGVAPCTAALQAKRRKIYAVYQKPGHLEKKAASKRVALGEGRLRKMAEELKIDFHSLDRAALDKLSANRPHQGVILDVAPLSFRRMDSTESKLSEKERSSKPVWVLLDEVQDPMNLGAILRCSYYLGASRVLVSLKRCCPLSPTVSKASAGAMELMPVYSVANLEKFLKEAKKNGWQVLGTAGPEPPEEEDKWHEETRPRKDILHVECSAFIKQGPVLLALGNEGRGLHREVKEECDFILTVGAHRELPPGFDSLNVAVATGILLHCLQGKGQHALTSHLSNNEK